MRPFFLTRANQLCSPPPPAFGSPAFLAALAEVRQIADTRTPEQDAIAKFWALPGGYAVAQSYNNRIATDLITQYHLDERRAAHAITGTSMAVLGALFPSRANSLWGLAEQAGISRIYGGIHYRFDSDAGLTIARQPAAWALVQDVSGHDAFPIR